MQPRTNAATIGPSDTPLPGTVRTRSRAGGGVADTTVFSRPVEGIAAVGAAGLAAAGEVGPRSGRRGLAWATGGGNGVTLLDVDATCGSAAVRASERGEAVPHRRAARTTTPGLTSRPASGAPLGPCAAAGRETFRPTATPGAGETMVTPAAATGPAAAPSGVDAGADDAAGAEPTARGDPALAVGLDVVDGTGDGAAGTGEDAGGDAAGAAGCGGAAAGGGDATGGAGGATGCATGAAEADGAGVVAGPDVGTGTARGGRRPNGSTYPSASLHRRIPRWTLGTGCSGVPLEPMAPIGSPSATTAPFSTPIVPRWTSVTAYPSSVWIVTPRP
jgi:hypothetical protein